MPTVAIIELLPRRIRAGIVGNYRVQVSQEFEKELWSDNCGLYTEKESSYCKTGLHFTCVDILDQLLVTATKTQVVIVEPPLLPYLVKQWLAQIFLEEIRALSLVFVPLSVCTVVGNGQKHGLVAMNLYGQAFLVPVYEYRELTPNILSATLSIDDIDDDEMPLQRLIERTKANVGYDIRKSMSIINIDLLEDDRVSAESAYIGAHIIAGNSSIRHHIGRKKYMSREQDVYDSLFT